MTDFLASNDDRQTIEFHLRSFAHYYRHHLLSFTLFFANALTFFGN